MKNSITALLAVLLATTMVDSFDANNDIDSWDAVSLEIETIVEELEERGITAEKLFNVRRGRDIDARSKLVEIQPWMEEKIKSDYMLNIDIAFQLLGKVGDLLRISYAGCKGYSCQVAVSTLHSKYQNMIYASARVSNYFVRSTARTLRYHRYAVRHANNERFTRALKWFKRCVKIADQLVKKSNEMVTNSEKLQSIAEQALNEANTNDVANTNEIKKNNATMQRVKQRNAIVDRMLKDLMKRETELSKDMFKIKLDLVKQEEEYQKVKKRPVKINTICKQTTYKKCCLGMGGEGVTKTCHTEFDKADTDLKKHQLSVELNKIVALRRNRLGVLKLKDKIQSNKTSLLGEQAGNLKGLSHAQLTKSGLSRARHALHMAIQTLSLVKTIFLQHKHYWEQVTYNAGQQGSKGDAMDSLQEHAEEGDSELFQEVLIESGFDWLALGKVSFDAHKRMIEVRAHVDETFTNVPSHKQIKIVMESAKEIIDETSKLLKMLDNTNNITKNEIKKAEKEILEKPLGENDEAEDEKAVTTLLS